MGGDTDGECEKGETKDHADVAESWENPHLEGMKEENRGKRGVSGGSSRVVREGGRRWGRFESGDVAKVS